MDYTVLCKEIKTIQSSGDCADIAAVLNAPRETGTQVRTLAAGELLDAIADSKDVLALLTSTEVNAVAVRAVLRLAGGIDVTAGTYGRDLLAAVVSANALARVVDAATVPVVQSRAEELGIERVGEGHVRSALAMMSAGKVA